MGSPDLELPDTTLFVRGFSKISNRYFGFTGINQRPAGRYFGLKGICNGRWRKRVNENKSKIDYVTVVKSNRNRLKCRNKQFNRDKSWHCTYSACIIVTFALPSPHPPLLHHRWGIALTLYNPTPLTDIDLAAVRVPVNRTDNVTFRF